MRTEVTGSVTHDIRTSVSVDAIDILDVAGNDGVVFDCSDFGFAGRGEALRIEVSYDTHELRAGLDYVAERLGELPSQANGEGPIAFVSIPFTGTQPILAIVPELIVRRESGHSLKVMTIGTSSPGHLPAEPESPEPQSFEVVPGRSTKEWCEAVGEAVTRLKAGLLDKVVLARQVIVEADAPFSQRAILKRLRSAHSGAMRFAIDGFIGASPELLIERVGRTVRAEPMAGTAPRSSDPELDELLRLSLLSSDKDRAEHQYLVDVVRETLARHCDHLVIPAVPNVVSLSNVHHLATPAKGTLRTDTSVLELVAALHPTPAVGGRPRPAALETIAELEEFDRGRYAGAVGWIDQNGDGRFAVAIRCAQLRGTKATLYAGNGIVAESDPSRELEENQAKFQTMLGALVRP